MADEKTDKVTLEYSATTPTFLDISIDKMRDRQNP